MPPLHLPLRLLFALALLVFASACGSDEDEYTINTADLETDATEAVILSLLSEAETEINANSDLHVSIILGEIVQGQPPSGTSDTFLERFADHKHRFVPVEELALDRDTKATVIQKTTIIPLLIQIMDVSTDPSGTTIDAAWNFGKDAVAKRFLVTETNGTLDVTETVVLRDNRKPIQPANVSE